MKIGIYTYGTRGDVQPYIALALGLLANGHQVTLAAPSNFQTWVEGFGISFFPLYGDAEHIMNSPEGQRVLNTENSIKLMQHFFEVLHAMREPLRISYFESISQVDYVIANSATLPIVSAIVEKQQKKLALTYFMPPVVPTAEFPMGDFDFLNIGWYNRLTYQVAHYFYWKFVKKETNEYRHELGLPILKENLLSYLNKQKPLDLYCFSPLLIPQPRDWEEHHKITGFLTLPNSRREAHLLDQTPDDLSQWLKAGAKPIYIGFGSNGIGNKAKFIHLLTALLQRTNERILFCSGWSSLEDLPSHSNLFVTKYVNHEVVLPQCKLAVFHGGAGTLATVLRHQLPMIIVSFYTDQPTWGKIVEKKKWGMHIPLKKLTAEKMLRAISAVQSEEIRIHVAEIGRLVSQEKGVERAIYEIERYFLD